MARERYQLPWARLRKLGFMGLNERNADFVLRYNARERYPLVDDKRRTKALAQAAGMPVPALYGVVEIVHQIERLDALLEPYADFVIKPSHGTGGEGILIVTGRQGPRYRLASACLADGGELGHHVSNILSGMYSLGGLPDCALIEYRVKFDPVFDPISYQGVPDIRTLVFRGVPVLAMVRLPTRLSGGKANLHQGAIGVGIDIASGLTAAGIWHDGQVDQHPDTGGGLAGRQIPYWEDILTLTARCYDLVGLGFIGVDIVLDHEQGPMMLEINARPGLSIQLANRAGLLPRLKRIEDCIKIPESARERVSLARSLAADLSVRHG